MKYVYKHDLDRFVQFAVRVWGVDMDFAEPERTALEGINRMEGFFRGVGLPVRFSELEISDEKFGEMAEKCTAGDTRSVGNFIKLHKEDVYNIYKLAK